MPSFDSLFQELIVISFPDEGIKVNAIEQDGDSSSFHEATDSSSINNSFSETTAEGPAMTFTEPIETVIVGGIVSFCGSGSTGVTGVGGSGSGSGPCSGSPQDTTIDTTIRAVMRYLVISVAQNGLVQRISGLVIMDSPTWETKDLGIRITDPCWKE